MPSFSGKDCSIQGLGEFTPLGLPWGYSVRTQIYQFRETLYQLTQDYGTRTELYRITYADTDPASGIRTWVRTVVTIPKGIFLPSMLARSILSGSFQRNVNADGGIDIRSRVLILDRRHLPKGYQIALEDMIIIHSTRYNVKTCEDLQGVADLLTITSANNQTPFQELHLRASNSLQLAHGAIL